MTKSGFRHSDDTATAVRPFSLPSASIQGIPPMIEIRQKTLQVGIRQRSLGPRCRLGRATELVFILATGVTLALSGGAEAQTWDGETSADWTEGTNWNPDGAPAAVDTATIAGNGANAPEVLVDTSVTVEEVEVTDGTLTVRGELIANSFVNVSGTGVVRVEPGVGLNGILSSLVDIEAGGTLSVAGLIDGTVRVNAGTLELDGGIIDDGTPTHTVAIQQGGIVRAISDSTLDGALIEVIANETGTITAADGVTLTIATGDLARRIDSTTTFGTAGVAGTVVIAPTSSITIGANSVVNVAGGTLQVGSAFVGGTYFSSGSNISTSVDSGATIDVNGFNTTIQRLSGAGTITNDGAAAATVTLNNPTGGNTDFSGVIENGTSAVAVTKSGAGTMTLSGTNTYTGTTTVSAGTLAVTGAVASAVVNVTGGILSVDGAALNDDAAVTLSGTGNLTLTGSETIGSLAGVAGTTVTLGTNTLTTGGNDGTTEMAGVISGDGGLTKEGTGNFTLSGANTYAGATAVDEGTLTISNGAALGTTAAGTTVADGATLALSGGITTGEAITLNGTGVGDGGALVNVSGNNTLSGQITLGSATLITSSDTDFADQLNISGGITGTDTNLTLGGAGSFNITGAITTGSGTLTKDGTGIAFLQGANAFTGATTINGGSITVSSGTALSDTALVTINAPGLLAVQTSETVGNIAGDGQINLFAAATLTAGDATPTSTFSGTIIDNNPGDAGNFTKQGTGTLILSGTNTYTGTTTISAGTLQVGDGGTTGTLGAGGVTNNAALVFNRSDAITVGNVISGSGTVTQAGMGNTTLSGVNTYAGATNVNAGTLTISNGSALGTTAAGTTVADGATLALTGGISTGEAITLNGAGAGVPGGGALRSVSGTNAITGVITLATDATITSVSSEQFTVTGAGSITGTGALTIAGTGNVQILGVIGPDVASLTANNTAITQIGGTNTFTGATTINAGALFVSGGSALSDTATVTVNSPGVFVVSASETVGGLVGAGNTTLQVGSTLTLSPSAGSVTYSGVIDEFGGVGNLVKTGAGTQVLTGNNTYTGTTTVNAGTLQVGNATTTGTVGTGNVVVTAPGTLAFNRSNDQTIANVFTGTGTINHTGTFTTILTGSNAAGNNFTGTTNVNGGTLRVNGVYGDTAANLSVLNVNTGATLQGTGTIRGTVNVNEGGTLSAGASPGVLTIAGPLNLNALSVSAFELNVANAPGSLSNDRVDVGGALTLDGTLSLTPGTPADGYYRLFTHAGALTNNGLAFSGLPTGSAVLVNVGGEVNLRVGNTPGTQFWDGAVANASNGTAEGGTGTWSGSEANWTISNGFFNDAWGSNDASFGGAAGTVTVSGTQSVDDITFTTTGYTLTGGSLSLNGASSDINVLAAGTATINSALNGAAALDKTGAGTLTLGGVNGYTGATTVTAGTLVIATGGSIVSTSTVNPGSTMTVQTEGTAAGITNNGTLNVFGAAGAVTNTGTATIIGTALSDAVASLTNTAGTTTIGDATEGVVTGNTSVSGGSVILTNSNLGDASTVTVSGTGTLTVNDTDTVGVLDQTGGTIDGGSTLTVAGAFTQEGGATDGSVIVNAGSFTQDGGTIGSGTTVSVDDPGTKTLNGGTINGTLTGTGLTTVQTATTLLNGTISGGATTIAADGVLELTGDSTVSDLLFAGGELTASADATLSGFSVGVQTLDQTGTISAANGVTLTLASDLFRRGFSTSGSTTTFGSAGNDGTVVIATTGAGAVGNNSAVVIAEGTVVIGSGAAGSFAFDNDDGFATGVTTTVDATLDINGFATRVANLSGDGDIVNNGADAILTLQTDQDSTFDGVIADSFGVISVEKVQGGTQILTADQAYTGTTTITAGTLQAGNGGVSGSFGGGDIIVNAPGTATLNRSDDITVDNLFIGNGTLVHAGTGTTELTAVNSPGSQFTGIANIDAGTVQLNGLLGDSDGNSATMNVNSGGTLQGTGTFAGTVNVNAGGTIAAGASPGTFNVGGDLVLAGTSEFELGDADILGGNGPTNDLINVTGNLTLGGALDILNSGSLGTGYYRLFNYGGTQSGTFASVTNPLAGGGITATVLTNVNGQVNLRMSDGSTPVQFWDGTDVVGNGVIDGNTGTWDATTPSWTNANGSFNDGWLSGEGVFQGTGGDVAVVGAQTFQGLTFDVTDYVLSGDGTLVSPTAGGFSNLIVNGAATDRADINVAITGAGGINKSGAGILNLGAQSTYLGATDVAEGTLRLTTDNALPAGTDVTVFNGAILNVNGTEQEIRSLTGMATATVDLDTDGRLIVTGPDSTIFAGDITGGDGSLFDLFNGTLELTGASTMTGTMSAFSGTLELAAGATTAATAVGAVNDGAQFITNGGALANNAVVFTRLAGSVVRFNGSETVGFLGSTSEGLGQTAGLGTIDLNGAGVVLTLTGNANVPYASTFSEHAGLISGAGALTVTGGTHRLSGAVANTYLGTTTVSGGTLELAGGVAIRDGGLVDLTGTGTLRVVNSETIGQLTGAATTFLVLDETLTTGGTNAPTEMAGVVSGAGGLTKQGTGIFTLSNANTYAGLTTINAGTVSITNGTALGTTAGGTTVADGGTLQLLGGITVGTEALTINGNGAAAGGALRSAGGANTWGGAITLGSASLISTTAGSLTLANTATVNNGGNLLTVTGPGNTTMNGAISGAGGLTKQGTGNLTLSAVNTYAGATTLATGTMTITATGQIANTASVLVGAGTTLLNNGGINTGSTTTVAGTGIFTNNGTAGAVNNAGTLTNAGSAGAVDNTGTATNSGTMASLANSGTFTSNAGTVFMQANNNGGTMTINSGSFSSLNNNSGVVSANGAMTGNITNAGSFNVTGALTGGGGTFTNTGALNVNSNYTGLSTVTNSLTVALAGTTLGTAGLTNNGTVTVTGSTATESVLSGGLSGTGVVDLGANDSNGQQLRLSGPAGSVGAHTFRLGYATSGLGDVLISDGGNVFSNATQNLNVTLQDNFALGTTATVVQGQTGLSTNLSVVNRDGVNLNTGGALLYSITDVGSNTLLAVEANPAVGGIASGVSLTQSLVANVVNRPSSPFASGLASEIGCSQGGYGRAVGGRAEAKGSSFSGVVNRENSLTAKYFGVQAGYDFICNDGRFFDGWNGGAGVLLGYNKGSTDQPVLLDLGGGILTQTSVTKSDFDQKYAGFYVVGNKEGLTVDAQVRFEDTEYMLNENPVPGFDGLGLSDSTFDTRSTNFTGRVSYNIPINEEGLNFVPTAGFSITRTGAATLNFTGVGLGNRLDLDAYTSKVGFIGGTLAKTRINEEAASGSTLFVSGNYYHEFGGDRTATFTAAGTPTAITSDNLGGFGELSFGWNYIKVLDAGSAGARQVNTNLRLDTRFGSNISNSYSLTAQVRLSF